MTHPDAERLRALVQAIDKASKAGLLTPEDSGYGKRAILDRLVGPPPESPPGPPPATAGGWWVCSEADRTPRPWSVGEAAPRDASFWRPGLTGWQRKPPTSGGGEWEAFSVGGERFRLRRVDADTYWVGSRDNDGDARDTEKPRHSVRFTRAYGVGEFAVTQGLYAAVMGENPSKFSGESDSVRRPVEEVSWHDAVAFCNRLSERCGLAPAYRIRGEDVQWRAGSPGFRLPTEHEWEVAARAGTDLKYAGSDELDAVGWFRKNSGKQTHPVGQKAPNSWGLYDLSGKVNEWCWDATRVVTSTSIFPWPPPDTLQPYSSGTVTDPTGHPYQSGALRVLRGGSWYGFASDARVADRGYYDPSLRDVDLGFRLTRTLP